MPQTILVAEDDKHINEVVSEYLKESALLVISADDGAKAQRLIMENDNISLFILDIMLPGLSGLELLRNIRNDERYAKTPVMMLTALSDEYTQLISFEGLADDYVTKPFSPKVLVKRVQALLRRSGAFQSSQILQTGSVQINFDSYEAFEEGERVILTLREFELLKVLMQHQRKVLSRQQLLNLVWGYDYFGDERIVDVHIKNLRKKFKANIITTVKGVGYKSDMDGDEKC